jgi:hypothetical protein
MERSSLYFPAVVGIDSHTQVYESDIDYAIQCARIDEAYKMCEPDVALLGYIEHFDGSMTLITDVTYCQYQYDDRAVWL